MDLERLVATDGPQPPARVIHILKQAVRGLAEAHDVGLVHRDIKPANIFLCRRWGDPDFVKVLDFGLAKDNAAAPSAAMTGEGTVLGTPLYISPEALSGANRVDARSDIYSLGAVGYYMLAGRPVFEGGSAMEVCAHHICTQPVPPAARLGKPLPADLEAIVLRCLAKSPAERYQTAREVWDALVACTGADEWTSDEARAWWEGRGDAPADKAADSRVGRTVEIDAGARAAAIDGAGPTMPVAVDRDR
jgi:serine/threonine-protein kinase